MSMLNSPALETWKLHLELPCWRILAPLDDAHLAELRLEHLSRFLCVGSGTGEWEQGNSEHHQKEE